MCHGWFRNVIHVLWNGPWGMSKKSIGRGRLHEEACLDEEDSIKKRTVAERLREPWRPANYLVIWSQFWRREESSKSFCWNKTVIHKREYYVAVTTNLQLHNWVSGTLHWLRSGTKGVKTLINFTEGKNGDWKQRRAMADAIFLNLCSLCENTMTMNI